MEIGQVIEQTKGIFLSKNYSEKKAGRLVPYVFLFFRKNLYEEIQHNAIVVTLDYNNNKLHKTLGY